MTEPEAQIAARQKYLRARALERMRCDDALQSGYVLDPEYSEAASNELLLRFILPFRRPRLADRIISVSPEFIAKHQHFEPADRWARARALGGGAAA